MHLAVHRASVHRDTSLRHRAGLAASLVAIAAIIATMVIPAAPAMAGDEANGIPTLEISSQHEDGDVVVDGEYTYRFEVRNNSGQNMRVDPGAFLDIAFAYDSLASFPQLRNCDFKHVEDIELDLRLGYWELDLPTVIPPGLIGECEITYRATKRDVAQGGLWTMMIFHPTAEWSDWAYWWTYPLPAKGVHAVPQVAGDGRAGHRVTVSDNGFWGPVVYPHVPDFEYRWYRGDDLIPRATSRTYVPTAADVGKELAVGVISPWQGIEMHSEPIVIQPPGPVVLTDVSGDRGSRHYSEFYDEIVWLAESGITTGYYNGDGTSAYRPLGKVTRDAMAAFLYRNAGSPDVELPARSPFVDVTPQNTDFYKEIVWLAEQGISTGWDTLRGKEFRPRQTITRDAMAAFLYRSADEPTWTAPAVSPFADVSPSRPFYREITWLADSEITTGWTVGARKEFRSLRPITRDAMAAFLYRYDERFGGEDVSGLSVLPDEAEPLAGARSALNEPAHRASGGAFVGSCEDGASCPDVDRRELMLAGE